MDDQELIKNLKNGDEYAYKILYENYYSWLCNYTFKFCQNRKLSEDIVQDTLFKIYKKRKKIDITSSLKNYLFRSCHNQFLEHLRKQKIKFDVLDEIKWEAIADSMDDSKAKKEEKLEKLHEFIDELPPRCKEIFVKHKLQKVKYKDIAIELGISVKTVENQMSKALHFLKNRANILLIVYFYVLAMLG